MFSLPTSYLLEYQGGFDSSFRNHQQSSFTPYLMQQLHVVCAVPTVYSLCRFFGLTTINTAKAAAAEINLLATLIGTSASSHWLSPNWLVRLPKHQGLGIHPR